MQYPNSYPHNGHQTQQPHSSSHHPQLQHSPSNSNSHNSGYHVQQPHRLPGYPPNNPLSNAMIGATTPQPPFYRQVNILEAGNHSSSILQAAPLPSNSQHGTSPTTDPRRPYYPSQVDQPNSYFSPHQHSSAPGPPYAMNPHLDSQNVRAHAQFIPTPSQTYQVYSNTTTSSQRVRPVVEPYYHMSPNAQHTTQSSSSPPLRSAHISMSPSSNPALYGDRYPCNLCDRSFTRSHDRRRHCETVHAPTPLLHRCRYCGKDFSRADSLKRHVDNGCDEMQSHK